jgi:hypothetical protein
MNRTPCDRAPIEIREDLAAAHRRARDHLARPGTWWDGAERVAVMAEARHAVDCALCRRRKEALSPAAVARTHDSLGELPEIAVEVVHRIRTDPAGLTHGWYQDVVRSGLTPEQYVEIVSVVAHTVALDTFARGIGILPLSLPNPAEGMPTRHRPAGAKPGPAWVPWIEAPDITEAEAGIYPLSRPPANIHKAMSLVPAEVKSFFDLCEHLGDARFRPRVPRHHACPDRAAGGEGLGPEPVLLLNHRPYPTAPCEQPA